MRLHPMIRRLILFLVLVLCPAPSLAAIRYVSASTGSDVPGAGSISSPFRTINYALSQSTDDDDIRVAAGTYPEGVGVYKYVSLFGGYDPVTWIRNVTVFRTVVDGGGGAFSKTFSLGFSGVTIDGFVIQNGANGVYREDPNLFGGGSSVTISNNLIRNNFIGIVTMANFYAVPSPAPTLSSNNLIINNGVGIYTHSEAFTLYDSFMHDCREYWQNVVHTSTNDTISNNLSMGAASDVYIDYDSKCVFPVPLVSRIDLRNDIIFSNPTQLALYQGSIDYSDVGAPSSGTGNLNADPRFWEPALTDHTLQPDSPCINAGDPNPIYNNPDGSRNDMGFTGGDSPWFDADSDGMPDEWETYYGLNPDRPADAAFDCDCDGAINRLEYFNWTDPGDCSDTDGDGMLDYWEELCLACGLDPLVGDSTLDPDSDGVDNLAEFLQGSDPCGCTDHDGDAYFAEASCGVTPDCDDADPAHWTDCGLCGDLDGDGRGPGCNLGADCDDGNPWAWDACATCHDNDGDGYYELCNAYNGINGPDCDDDNTYAWDACATCHDDDGDTWRELCDRYVRGAPPLVTIGAGTGTTTLTLLASWEDARTQVIYLASEIGGAGTITAVALDVTTIPGQTLNNFTIRMKHTALNSYPYPYFWEGPASGWITVHQNNEPRGATGWRTFTLSTPFSYNGTSNLMVDFSFNNSFHTTSGWIRYTDSGADRTFYESMNGQYGDPLNWTGISNPTPLYLTYIPNLRISISNLSINGPDCDDHDPTINLGAAEITCDHVDQDCDGLADDGPNLDGDPVSFCDGDCDDTNPARYPGAAETTCDAIDQDCDGLADDDPNADADPVSLCAGDCDDTDPTIYPGAAEITCDHIDQDCDGLADSEPNLDGDPVSSCDGDCDDTDPARYPGAAETTCDAIDQDCDGLADDNPNADADPVSLCAGDCNDTNPTIYPGAVELTCDHIDQDCDGLADDDPNADADPVSLCAGDCNDTDPTIYPDATEIRHDDIDQDCDGLRDDDPPAGKKGGDDGGGCGCMVAPLAPASASLVAAGLYALPLVFALGLRKAAGKKK